MSNANPPPEDAKQPLGILYAPEHALLHEQRQEDIVLSRWRLLHILETIERGKRRPKFDDAWPWIGVFVAFFLALVPRDFQDFLGFPPEVWNTVGIVGTVVSVIKIGQIYWRIFKVRKQPEKTSEQIVEELMDEMRTQGQAIQQPVLMRSQPESQPGQSNAPTV